ncbi:hypothetical protein BGW39_003598 [Mortierella sp. 14UC]|nr:hypothetical protein BGW39_003598 [Mortierella sp. 14UC]
MLQELDVNKKQTDDQQQHHPTVDQLLARVNNQNKALTLLTEQVFAMATRLDETAKQNQARQDALVQQFTTKLDDLTRQHKTQLEDMARQFKAQVEDAERGHKGQVEDVVSPRPKDARRDDDSDQDGYHTAHTDLDEFSLNISDNEADVANNHNNTKNNNGSNINGSVRPMDMHEVEQWLGEGYRRMDDLDAWMNDVLVRMDRMEARFGMRRDRAHRDDRDWDMESTETVGSHKSNKHLDEIDDVDEEAEEKEREKEEERRRRDQYRNEVKSRARGKRKSLDFDFVSDFSVEDYDDDDHRHSDDEEMDEGDDDDYKEEDEYKEDDCKERSHKENNYKEKNEPLVYHMDSDNFDEGDVDQEDSAVGEQPLTSVFGHRTLNLLLDEVAGLYHQPSKKEAMRQGNSFKFHTPISSALEDVWQRWIISEPDRPSIWCLEAYTDKWRKNFSLTEKSAYYIQRRIIYNVFKHLRHINKTAAAAADAGTTAAPATSSLEDRVEQAMTIVKNEIEDVGSLYKYSRPPTKKRNRGLRHQQPGGTAATVSGTGKATVTVPAAGTGRSKRARKVRRFDD